MSQASNIKAQLNTAYGAIAGPGLGMSPIPSITLDSPDITSVSESSLNIRIVPAHGGHIVSIREEHSHSYSTKSDLHIVPTEQDLGAVLGQLITLHYLKK